MTRLSCASVQLGLSDLLEWFLKLDNLLLLLLLESLGGERVALLASRGGGGRRRVVTWRRDPVAARRASRWDLLHLLHLWVQEGALAGGLGGRFGAAQLGVSWRLSLPVDCCPTTTTTTTVGQTKLGVAGEAFR